MLILWIGKTQTCMEGQTESYQISYVRGTRRAEHRLLNTSATDATVLHKVTKKAQNVVK